MASLSGRKVNYHILFRQTGHLLLSGLHTHTHTHTPNHTNMQTIKQTVSVCVYLSYNDVIKHLFVLVCLIARLKPSILLPPPPPLPPPKLAT